MTVKQRWCRCMLLKLSATQPMMLFNRVHSFVRFSHVNSSSIRTWRHAMWSNVLIAAVKHSNYTAVQFHTYAHTSAITPTVTSVASAIHVFHGLQCMLVWMNCLRDWWQGHPLLSALVLPMTTDKSIAQYLSLIHIWRCRRSTLCRSRWSPYH